MLILHENNSAKKNKTEGFCLEHQTQQNTVKNVKSYFINAVIPSLTNMNSLCSVITFNLISVRFFFSHLSVL